MMIDGDGPDGYTYVQILVLLVTCQEYVKEVNKLRRLQVPMNVTKDEKVATYFEH